MSGIRVPHECDRDYPCDREYDYVPPSATTVRIRCYKCGRSFPVLPGSGAEKDGLCDTCWPRVMHPEWPWPS